MDASLFIGCQNELMTNYESKCEINRYGNVWSLFCFDGIVTSSSTEMSDKNKKLTTSFTIFILQFALAVSVFYEDVGIDEMLKSSDFSRLINLLFLFYLKFIKITDSLNFIQMNIYALSISWIPN